MLLRSLTLRVIPSGVPTPEMLRDGQCQLLVSPRPPAAADLLQQRLFVELNAYAKFHFISEENLMFRHKYPGLQAHELQHRTLIDQLSAKQGLFGLKRLAAGEVIGFLQSWFIGHTTHEDRLFADFLRQQR